MHVLGVIVLATRCASAPSCRSRDSRQRSRRRSFRVLRRELLEGGSIPLAGSVARRGQRGIRERAPLAAIICGVSFHCLCRHHTSTCWRSAGLAAQSPAQRSNPPCDGMSAHVCPALGVSATPARCGTVNGSRFPPYLPDIARERHARRGWHNTSPADRFKRHLAGRAQAPTMAASGQRTARLLRFSTRTDLTADILTHALKPLPSFIGRTSRASRWRRHCVHTEVATLSAPGFACPPKPPSDDHVSTTASHCSRQLEFGKWTRRLHLTLWPS